MTASNVEDYGVKVSFDNKDFDNNVDSSEKKLNSFSKSLSSFSESIKNISFNGNVNLGDLLNFAALQTGFYRIRHEIESLADPIESVSNKALMIVSNTMNKALNQIKSGGMQRALNIEAAKFQIEGLKLDVDTFMEAADYAVSGTAYSLDAAAKAASQMGASGITQLEDLKKALRGISGVAAMANSDYESIAHIFTTVAGNGRLMSEQLNSLSAKGLNAAASLGKALNKTEAEIRDMVTKGQIDFKTFAMAMDDAFGEHAKDANKTFTGAMSNINAALSRVGEAFATPIIQNAVDVFNQIRLSINELKTELQENFVFEYFGEVVEDLSKKVTTLFEEIRYGIKQTPLLEEISYLMKDIFSIVKEVGDVLFKFSWGEIGKMGNSLSVVVNKAKQLLNAFKEAFDEVFGIRTTLAKFSSVAEWAVTLLDAFEGIDDLQFKDTIKNWLDAIKQVLTTIKDVLGISFESRKAIKDMFSGAVQGAMEFFASLKLSEDTVDKLKRTFSGVASIAVLIKSLATAIFNFVQPVISGIAKAIGGLGKVVLTVLAHIGDFFTELAKAEKEQRTFETFFETLKKYFSGILDFLKNVGTAFGDIFFGNSAGDQTFIENVFAFIEKVGELASKAIDSFNFGGFDFSPIKDFIANLSNFGFSSEEMSKTEEGLEKSEGFISKVIGFVKKIFSSLFSKDGKDVEQASEKVKSSSKFADTLREIMDWVKDIIETIVQNVDPVLLVSGSLVGLAIVLDSIANILDISLKGIAAILAVILGFITEKDIKKFLDNSNMFDKVGTSFDTMSKAFKSLTDKLPDLAKSLKGMVDDFKPFEGILPGSSPGEQIADILLKLAILVGAVAAGLFVIALIPETDLNKAVGAMAIMIGLITAVVVGLAILSKTMAPITGALKSPLTSIGITFALVSFAIVEIAEALKIVIKAFKGVSFKEGLGVIGAISAMMVLISGIIVGFTFLQDKIAVLPSDFLFLAGAFALFGFAITEIALSIGAIALAIGDSNKIELAWAATGMIAAIVAVIGLILGLLGGILGSEGSVALLAAGGGMMLMMTGLSAVIMSMSAMLLTISMIPIDKLEKAGDVLESMIGTIGTITVILSIIGLVGGLAGELGSIGFLALAAALVSFALVIGSISMPLLSFAITMKSIAEAIGAIKDFFYALKDMDSDEVEKVSDGLVEVIEKIAVGIPEILAKVFVKGLEQIKNLFPIMAQFFSGSIIPFISDLLSAMSTPVSEKLIQALESVLMTTKDYLPEILRILYDIMFGPSQILDNIFLWLDELWDRLVVWLTERIPVWTEDIADLLLLLIHSINDALEGKWDEFDEEISKLIQNSLELINDILTGAQTVADVKSLMGTIIQTLVDGISENSYLIKDAFMQMAEEAVSSFFDGLSMNGFGDSLGFSFTDLFSGGGFDSIKSYIGGYNTSPVYQGNNIPYSDAVNRQQQYDQLINNYTSNTTNTQDINLNITNQFDKDQFIKYTWNKTSKLHRAGMQHE